MEPFTKAGDKNPMGMKHGDLKKNRGKATNIKIHSQELQAEEHLVDLSHVSRTVAAGAGSTALEENLNQHA